MSQMLQVDPKKQTTVRQLEDKYVRTEEWASVRDGWAIRKCVEWVQGFFVWSISSLYSCRWLAP